MDLAVVIPTYNRGTLIVRALESVCAQTRLPGAIVVVDDGSTDDTQERLKQFGSRITVIRQENAGGAAARNRGVRHADAPWIAFLDSDDVWAPTHLERVARAMEATGGRADLYFDDIEHHGMSGEFSRWSRSEFCIRGDHELTPDATEWVMREEQPMTLPSSVVRRSRFLELGGFWEELRTAHDTHMFLLLGIGRPVCAVSGVGSMQLNDDRTDNRLTVKTGPVKLRRYVNTARLFADALDRYPELERRYRHLLHARAGESFWRAARLSWKVGDVSASLRFGARSLSSDPGGFASRLLSRKSSEASREVSAKKAPGGSA